MADTRAVLKPGDLVRFDGDEHLVTGLAGTSVRLRSESGNNQVVLAGYLMAAPDFAVLDATELPALEPFGLLESLPANVVADAQRWREHLVEVETGLPPDSGPGVTPRAGYDPAITSLAQRQRVKAAELGVGPSASVRATLRTAAHRSAPPQTSAGRDNSNETPLSVERSFVGFRDVLGSLQRCHGACSVADG